VLRKHSRRRAIVATILALVALTYSGDLDYHKAWDADHKDGGASKSQLLDNIRSAPYDDVAGTGTWARLATPDDDLGLDVGELTAALAFIVLAAARLPKGSPARRKMAEDARAIRDRLDLLAPV
jgi:hypothetical protein